MVEPPRKLMVVSPRKSLVKLSRKSIKPKGEAKGNKPDGGVRFPFDEL